MKRQSDWIGAGIGFLTFAVGIGLLGYTFKLAFDLFSIPPDRVIGPGQKGIDLAQTGQSLGWVIVRILLLFVMAAVGSMIANRGIKLYVSARALPPLVNEAERGSQPESVEASSSPT